MGPILLKPNYISPVWAGNKINVARGLDCKEPMGESFDVSVHDGLVNEVENGPHAGTPLDQLVKDHREEILGNAPGDGVVQIITMDAGENLSVQVHPDEAYAQANENDHEKAESWYVLSAEPGATIICGTTTDDIDALRAATDEDKVGDLYGRRVPVSEGDFVMVPAGTLHALGTGVFALEVGSFGFKTYRFGDWGRGRELHVKQGFDVLKTQNRPTPNHLGAFDPQGPAQVRRGVTHRLFVADVVDVRGSWEEELGGRYRVLSCVGGNATVSTPEGTVELPYTRSMIVPASAGSYKIEGTCRVLVSYATYEGETETVMNY